VYYASSAYSQHLRDEHGFVNQADAFGKVCPACPKADVEVMGSHLRQHSDIAATVPELFLWARDNNDPYGVYANRLAAGLRNAAYDGSNDKRPRSLASGRERGHCFGLR
jgi:hypothetical protein